jgi:uncharacterized protein (TIGR03086 family)
MPVDPVSILERVLGDASALVTSVSDTDVAGKTPCEAWDVRALVEHMTQVVTNFGTAFGGGALTPPNATGSTEASAADLSASYGRAVAVLTQRLREPGALDRTIKIPFGEVPGQVAVRIVQTDQLLHSWDLAKALGRPYTIDETLAAETLRGMHQLLGQNPNARGEGRAFGAEVPCPENAPVQDRLVAFAGRQP